MRPLEGKVVAFTGRLASMSRADAAEIVYQSGGKVSRRLTPDTNLLVVGQRGLPIGDDGRLTLKLRQAQAANRELNSIEISSEDQWLARCSVSDRDSVHQLLAAAEVCSLLGASPEQLRAWVRVGLIHPSSDRGGLYFDFAQVAAAKKLVELTRAGVTTAKIRRSLKRLKSWMPGIHAPLVQLGIIERSGTLLVRMEQGQLTDPEGQMHFEFTPSRPNMDSAPNADEQPAAFKLDSVPRTPEWWFDRGCQQEEAGDLKDAVNSYRQALLLGGPSADVSFNLANVLYALGQKAQASERYRQAVELDPEFIEAWNNLGIALAELKQCDDALWAYRKALELDPHYADAHYNLADCLDRNGCTTDARAHWEAYTRLDPASPWGNYAQGRLSEKSLRSPRQRAAPMKDVL